MSHDRDLIQRVIQLATENVRQGGRPFACVIAESRSGEILAEAANAVAQTGDPTAHAEMLAIRQASQTLRTANQPVDGTNGTAGEDMAGYTFYILTVPCTMCMTAMEYSGPDRLVYATTRKEYAEFYRDDRRHFAMETLTAATELIIAQSKLPVEHCPHPESLAVYRLWQELNGPQ
ncbi:MAG: nucleoside deaminase [Pirellulales bacterium]|jgi:guanine deaminase|nr:nucleoside deaminase [Pirellulales bacterium]HJN65356.1 nucleoside deaminase [Pirellulales bacterium]